MGLFNYRLMGGAKKERVGDCVDISGYLGIRFHSLVVGGSLI